MVEPQFCHLTLPEVPAIHRGQQDATEAIWELVPAHGATILFRRGQYPLWESILGWGTAHGELQELLKSFIFPSYFGIPCASTVNVKPYLN